MNHSAFEPVDLNRATNEQLAMVNASFAGDAPELWRDLAELNFVALRAVSTFDSHSDESLAVMAVNLVHQMVASFGGTQPYIPCGEKFHSSAKAAQVFKDFNGTNLRQLAMKHGLSESRVRQILNSHNASMKASRGGDVVISG